VTRQLQVPERLAAIKVAARGQIAVVVLFGLGQVQLRQLFARVEREAAAQRRDRAVDVLEHLVALGFGLARVHNVRCQQYDDLAAQRGLVIVAEQGTDHRQIAQARHLRLVDLRVLVEQAADDDRVTVADHDVTGHLGSPLARKAQTRNGSGRDLRVDFHANVPVVADERSESQRRAGIEELDVLDLAGRRGGGCAIAQPLTNDDLGPVLVQGQHLRVAEYVDILDRFQGLDKDRDVVGDETKLEPRSRRGEPCGADTAPGDVARGARGRGGIHHAVRVGQREVAHRDFAEIDTGQDVEVHPQAGVVIESHLENRRLNENLLRPRVNLLQQRCHGVQIVGIVRDDQHVGPRVGVALDILAAGGNPLAGRN